MLCPQRSRRRRHRARAPPATAPSGGGAASRSGHPSRTTEGTSSAVTSKGGPSPRRLRRSAIRAGPSARRVARPSSVRRDQAAVAHHPGEEPFDLHPRFLHGRPRPSRPVAPEPQPRHGRFVGADGGEGARRRQRRTQNDIATKAVADCHQRAATAAAGAARPARPRRSAAGPRYALRDPPHRRPAIPGIPVGRRPPRRRPATAASRGGSSPLGRASRARRSRSPHLLRGRAA